MPRLSVFRPSNPRNHLEGWNEPYDYCQRCYPSLARVRQMFGLGAAVDMDTEHPDYDLDVFKCEDCRKILEGIDG